MIFLLFLFYLPIIIQATISTREPVSSVSDLAAKILIYLPSPHSNTQGLNFNEIQHLRKVAETEQNAADWRSTFVNLIIIGTATLIVSVTNLVSQQFTTSDLQAMANLLINPPTSEMAFEFLPLFVITTAVITVILLWAGIKLYTYYIEFISAESANRTILLACDEATALLEIKQLQNKVEILFREKRALAEHLGCRLILRDQATPFDLYAGVPVFDKLDGMWEGRLRLTWDGKFGIPVFNETDEIWILLSPMESSSAVKLFYYWRRMMDRIRLILSRFRL